MENTLSLYAPRSSPIHALHPLTKLSLAGVALVLGLSLPGVYWTYLLLAVYIVPVSLLAQVAGQLFGSAWRIVLPFAISVFLIQGLFWQTGPIFLALGPLSLKTEGLTFALASTGRILTVISAFLLLALTTRPDELMIALDQRGLPPTLTYIVLATIQIVPRFQARAQTIIEAQRARGLETTGSILQRARGLLPLIVPLVLSSIVDVEERAIALEARAFNHPGPKTSYHEIRDRDFERLVRPALLATMVLAVLIRLAALIF